MKQLTVIGILFGKAGMVLASIWAFIKADEWFWFWSMDWKNLHAVDSYLTPGGIMVGSIALIAICYPLAYLVIKASRKSVVTPRLADLLGAQPIEMQFPFITYLMFLASFVYFTLAIHSYWHLQWGIPGTSVFVYPISSGLHFLVTFGVLNALGVRLGIWDSDDD